MGAVAMVCLALAAPTVALVCIALVGGAAISGLARLLRCNMEDLTTAVNNLPFNKAPGPPPNKDIMIMYSIVRGVRVIL